MLPKLPPQRVRRLRHQQLVEMLTSTPSAAYRFEFEVNRQRGYAWDQGEVP